MNSIVLIGRLMADPKTTLTSKEEPRCQFTVAVDRPYKNSDGTRPADFIPVVAWRQVGAFIGKHFRKGERIALRGSLQTRTVDVDGKNLTMMEVVADAAEFCERADRKVETELPYEL